MSSGLLVTVMLPWVNSCWTAATFVPIPTLPAPAPASELAKTSAKTAREILKPTVFEFATLLPTMSRFLAEALRPESPDWKPIDCSWLKYAFDVGDTDFAAVLEIEFHA